MKNDTFPEKALSFLALLAIFVTPLALFSGRLYPFVASKSFFFMGMAELTFFLWVYLAWTNSAYRLSKKQILIFLVPILLLISLTISSIFAPIPNLAFWGSFERATGLIFLYHCLAFGIVIASLIKIYGKEFLYKICSAVFYSGIIVALSTFINEHFINIPSLFLFDGPNSADLFGNSSFSAAYLVFSLFLGAILLLEKSNKKNKIWIALGLVIIIVSPISDMARGVMGGILVGAFVFLGVYLVTNVKKNIRVLGFFLLGLMLAGGVVAGVSLLQPSSKIHNAFAEAATNSRFIFWDAAIEGIKDRPIFGWGPENYIVVFIKHFDVSLLEIPGVPETWTDKPHSSVLEAFVIGGFVGGILYLAFLISLFAIPIYLYRKKILSRLTLALLMGMFVAYILQALILFDMVHTLVLMFGLFGVFVGLIFDGSSSMIRRSTSDTEKSIASIVCLIVFVFFWVYFVHQPLRKSKLIISSLDDSLNRQENIVKLINISPMGNGGDMAYVASVTAAAFSKNMTDIKKSETRVKSSHEEIQNFLDTIDTLEDVAKNNGRLWLVAAELINIDIAITDETTDENFNRAMTYLDRTKELIPNNPRIYWVYGQLYLNVDDYKKAYESYKKAYDINPKVSRSQVYLEKFEELFGNKI